MGIFEWAIAAILSLVSVPIGWLWARQNTMGARLDDTFTKAESKEMIDLKQQPLREALDRNSEVCHELVKTLTELRLEMARMRAGSSDGDKERTGS